MSCLDEAPAWRVSSKSNGTNCVEVGQHATAILVRDTKNRAAAGLSFPARTWESFTSSFRSPAKPRDAY